MIGTHDSCTGYGPTNSLWDLFSAFWRTLNTTLQLLLKEDVKYFDIRIRFKDFKWQCCHGLVDLRKSFSSITEILNWATDNKVFVRIILERGNKEDEGLFKATLLECKDYDCLKFAAIKKNWRVIIDRDFKIVEHYWTPFLSNLSLIGNIKRLFKVGIHSLKRYARQHNPSLLLVVYDDYVHLMDYFNER